MSLVELTGLVLAAEFAFVALALFFFMRRQHRVTQVTTHHAVQAASEHLAAQESSRRENLKRVFATTYHLQGQTLEKRVEEFIAREQAFYNLMLKIYLERDGAKLKELPDELLKVVVPWVELAPNAAPDQAAAALRQENARLAAELDRTKETIVQLLHEYDAAFARYQENAAAAKAKAKAKAGVASADEDNALDRITQPPPIPSLAVDSAELIKELDDAESEELADLFGDPKNARKF